MGVDLGRDMSIYADVAKGVVCLQSALVHLGYSSRPLSILVIANQYISDASYPICYIKQNPLNMEDTLLIRRELYVTNIERTLCELILQNLDEESICEGILKYLNSKSYSEIKPWLTQYDVERAWKFYNERAEKYWSKYKHKEAFYDIRNRFGDY